jgi:hypothetical protein
MAEVGMPLLIHGEVVSSILYKPVVSTSAAIAATATRVCDFGVACNVSFTQQTL